MIDLLGGFENDCFGLISLTRLDRDQSQLELWIAQDQLESDIALKAVQAVIRINPQNNTSIFTEVYQDDALLARIMCHVGFEYIGDAEHHCNVRQACFPTWTYIRKI